MGYYCRICGRTRANEKFSGKGHKNHVCKDCSGKYIDEYIKSLSHNFFTQNGDVVQKSVIPNSLKFLLKSVMV